MDIKIILWIPVISAAITLVFNWIFNYLQNEMNWNIDRKKFKREHSYNQLKELYLELYPIVVQSEYVRHYFKKYLTLNFPISEYPFLEIHKTKTIIKDGEITEEKLHTAITEFNKAKIVEKVMEKPQFASQRLLKLIVAYRYVHDNYLKEQDVKLKDNFQNEELNLINMIVITIVKECNELLEECNMPYDGKEISYGLIDASVFEDSDNY